MNLKASTKELRAKASLAKKFWRNATPQELMDKMGLDFEPEQKAMVIKKIQNIPPRYRMRYLQAMKGKTPLGALRLFCYDCVSYQTEEVRACSSLCCPLWLYRPAQ